MAKLRDTEDIKVITGVRRCGKTVLLKQIIDDLKNSRIASENIIYINFESSKYKNIKNNTDLDDFVFSKTKDLNGKVYLLFDEIQKVKNWEVSLILIGLIWIVTCILLDQIHNYYLGS